MVRARGVVVSGRMIQSIIEGNDGAGKAGKCAIRRAEVPVARF